MSEAPLPWSSKKGRAVRQWVERQIHSHTQKQGEAGQIKTIWQANNEAAIDENKCMSEYQHQRVRGKEDERG